MSGSVLDVRQTVEFADWFAGLRDSITRKRIARRVALLRIGHFGDVKSVGDKVAELRIDHGPGYRLYFTRRGETVILLLVGGDKSSQGRDIGRARKMAAALD